MIRNLELRTFKCFKLLRLPLAPLTLLSGKNSSGKSSILQSLVLLHQTMQEDEWSQRMVLNGSVMSLGTVTDVVDQGHGNTSLGIGLSNEETNCDWTFVGERDDMSLRVAKLELEGEVREHPEPLRHLLPEGSGVAAQEMVRYVKDLTYITAEREGPRDVYTLEDQYAVGRVGARGENAVSVFYRGRDEDIHETLRMKGALPTLRHQVGARMDSFFPGCAVDVQQVQNANIVTLGIRTSEEAKLLRPIHCGFGVTQVLPIVIATLSARQPGLVLIENPEVHLHPAGQALMGKFLAEVAHSGLQVIVETHSDHLLNGIRRAVRSRLVNVSEVVLHFFVARSTTTPQAFTPTLDDSGSIDFWPEGFFDQYDNDMDYLAGWSQ